MSRIHDFDEPVERRGTDCKKYDPNVYGADVIPMWLADTDFKCPGPVIDALTERISQGVFGYPAPSKDFRAAVAHWERERFGWEVPAAAVEYTPGVIPGIICAVRALSRPGDRIVVNSPCYPDFWEQMERNGRNLAGSSLVVKNGQYVIDWPDLEAKLADERTKLFILCNPQNPTGRVFTLQELTQIGRLCLQYGVIVLADEIHCDLVYRGCRHIPFASICQEFAQNSVTFVNASKTFNIAGFRTAAFICRNESIKSRIQEALMDNKGAGEGLAGIVATIAAYTKCQYYADQVVEYLEGNLDLACSRLAELNGRISVIRPQGTYLLWLDCRGLGLEPKELTEFFVHTAKVGLSPGSSFGVEGEGFMRMNLGTQRAVLAEAMDRIVTAVKQL